MRQLPINKRQPVTPLTYCRSFVKFSGAASNPFEVLPERWPPVVFGPREAARGLRSK
jgi:hypothetical protein